MLDIFHLLPQRQIYYLKMALTIVCATEVIVALVSTFKGCNSLRSDQGDNRPDDNMVNGYFVRW